MSKQDFSPPKTDSSQMYQQLMNHQLIISNVHNFREKLHHCQKATTLVSTRKSIQLIIDRHEKLQVTLVRSLFVKSGSNMYAFCCRRLALVLTIKKQLPVFQVINIDEQTVNFAEANYCCAITRHF